MKKVIISPSNARAIAFFEDLNKKKEELRKKFEIKAAKILKAKSGQSR